MTRRINLNDALLRRKASCLAYHSNVLTFDDYWAILTSYIIPIGKRNNKGYIPNVKGN